MCTAHSESVTSKGAFLQSVPQYYLYPADILYIYTPLPSSDSKSTDMANLKCITPFLDKLDHCLGIGQVPSQGPVFALDSDIVIKPPFQYIIPDQLDNDALFRLNHGV